MPSCSTCHRLARKVRRHFDPYTSSPMTSNRIDRDRPHADEVLANIHTPKPTIEGFSSLKAVDVVEDVGGVQAGVHGRHDLAMVEGNEGVAAIASWHPLSPVSSIPLLGFRRRG